MTHTGTMKTIHKRLLIGVVAVMLLGLAGTVYLISSRNATVQKGERVLNTVMLPTDWRRGPVKYESGGFLFINWTGPQWTNVMYSPDTQDDARETLFAALRQSGWHNVCSSDPEPCWYQDQRNYLTANFSTSSECPGIEAPCTQIQLALTIYDRPQIIETPATPKSPLPN